MRLLIDGIERVGAIELYIQDPAASRKLQSRKAVQVQRGTSM
jgi:hypothetical protein